MAFRALLRGPFEPALGNTIPVPYGPRPGQPQRIKHMIITDRQGRSNTVLSLEVLSRMRGTPQLRVWAWGLVSIVALLSACAHANKRAQSAPTTRPDSAVVRLPRAAYLVALDSSLHRVRGVASRVWIDGVEPLPFTSEDLAGRQAQRGNGDATCPGEAFLRFGAPTQQPDGRILLHVVEGAGVPPRGVVGHVYFFRCAGGTCRLEDDGQLEEDYMRTCGPGVGPVNSQGHG